MIVPIPSLLCPTCKVTKQRYCSLLAEKNIDSLSLMDIMMSSCVPARSKPMAKPSMSQKDACG